MMLTSISIDANEGIFPIAYAIVERETYKRELELVPRVVKERLRNISYKGAFADIHFRQAKMIESCIPRYLTYGDTQVLGQTLAQ